MDVTLSIQIEDQSFEDWLDRLESAILLLMTLFSRVCIWCPHHCFPPLFLELCMSYVVPWVRIYQRHFATWEPTSCEYSVGLIYRKYFWWHDSIFARQRHFLSRTAVPSPSTETIGYELLLASCNDRLFTRIHTLILGSSNPAWWTFPLQPPADNTKLESK